MARHIQYDFSGEETIVLLKGLELYIDALEQQFDVQDSRKMMSYLIYPEALRIANYARKDFLKDISDRGAKPDVLEEWMLDPEKNH